jgi:N-acetylneuraminate synthase
MKKVTIVAEIGVNHNGDIKLAKRMIKEAKKCGADVVKFQTFFADLFIKINTGKVKYQKKNTAKKENHYQMIKKLELKRKEFFKLKNYCDRLNIEFLSTPYDIESVDLLEQLKVKRYKVASADLVDMLLHKRILQTKKPVILSTGMATIEEIRKTVEFYKKNNMKKITLLHCVSNYPCSYRSINLNIIPKLKKLFNLPIGFSDHSEGNIAAILSVSLGGIMIEKHFTLDKNLPGPDHKASSTPREFSTLVKTIRAAETMLGNDQKKCQLEEREMRRIGRKSITLKRSMRCGEIINEKDIIMKRPGTGLNGQKIYMIIKKKLKKNFKKDHQIRKQDIL